MIYNAGTISLSGNTATGAGTSWTAPASQIRTGQTIIVLSNPVQLFQITAINSATSLTVTPAASPSLTGQKYGILVTDSLSVDGLAQSISQLINEYDENIGAWESFASTTANQNVTVTINGQSISIPALGKLVQKGTNGTVPVAQGGTGATNAQDARSNLGLGSSATLNVVDSAISTSTNVVLKPGYRGIGLATLDGGGGDTDPFYTNLNGGGFYTVTGNTPSLPAWWHPTSSPVWGGGIYISRTAVQIIEFLVSRDGKAGIRIRRSADTSTTQAEFYTTLNTTKASDGTLKTASPIVKIFSDGSFETNDESEGCIVTRLSVGTYLIEGCEALNADAAWSGWDGGFDIPTDRNKQPLIWLDYEVNADGSVLVKTYHRAHPDSPVFARNLIGTKGEAGTFTETIKNGEPIDIPSDQFVSVRVEMPKNRSCNLATAFAHERQEAQCEQNQHHALSS